jgi:hypothetical protein
MMPPIRSAIIWTASPTDFSSVVLVVEKPWDEIVSMLDKPGRRYPYQVSDDDSRERIDNTVWDSSELIVSK